ncbi:hypothetical protein ABZ464_18975 [Streptomyces sp. NPDC005820]|uniref:DUF4190 domain-containing protein n=1 Tax=Streptomyces sp. NPDC005820 TaxID=3157069 RepID=UPI00340FE118
MSDDAPTPAGDAGRETWPAPASAESAGPEDATPGVPLDKGAEGIRADAMPSGGTRSGEVPSDGTRSGEVRSDEVPLAEGSAPDPSPLPALPAVPTLPTGDARTGPGHTAVSHEPPTSRPATAEATPQATDSTFTSVNGAAPQLWAAPVAPQPNGPFASFPPPDPATLAGGPPPNPFAPPLAPTGAVPPPPISPDGPGQVPYGYPGGYGYPSPAPGGYYWPGMPPVESNGIGVTGMVLGIASAVIFCMWPVAIVVGVLGVIFGAIGRRKASRGEATNPGQALAGIICGIAGIALGVGLGTLTFMIPA